MQVQGVECGWKPGGWREAMIYGHIISGGVIRRPQLTSFHNNPTSPHTCPLPHILHNPLRQANLGQDPVMKTPSAAIAHV